MLKPWDFKLGSACDTSRTIQHFDKYPEFEGMRFQKRSGRSTTIFKSYIQRHFDWNHGPKLFMEYSKWYKIRVGSYKGLWKSWKDLCHTDFDLTHGYLWYEFLIQVPVIMELFENRSGNSTYISALKLAIFYDLVRFGRFHTVEDVYHIDGGVIFELTKSHFRGYMKRVIDKCDEGGSMSYENFRVLKWLAKIYSWKGAERLIANPEIRNRSKSKLVRCSTKKVVAKFNKKFNRTAEGYRLINKIVPIDTATDAITDQVWKLFREGESND